MLPVSGKLCVGFFEDFFEARAELRAGEPHGFAKLQQALLIPNGAKQQAVQEVPVLPGVQFYAHFLAQALEEAVEEEAMWSFVLLHVVCCQLFAVCCQLTY